jgi:hypothetical protein
MLVEFYVIIFLSNQFQKLIFVILGKGDQVFVRALNVLLVGAAEPSLELVVQLVEVSEVELAVLAPLAHAQTTGLSFDLDKSEKCLNI